MAAFFTRVELHGVHHDAKEYDILHSEMRKRGFSQSAPFLEGSCKLPPAEYYRTGVALVKEAVKTDAEAAATVATRASANKTGKKPAILVVQVADFCASGLDLDETPKAGNEEMNKAIRDVFKK